VSAAGRVDAATGPNRRAWLAPAIAVAGSVALILGPLLSAGYVLSYDMVFAPRMTLSADSLGLGSSVPRAVPSDLIVALASHILPGDLVQKLILVALLAGAGLGAARLAVPAALPRSVAALAYLWTPYVGERLLLGQWAVLVGYAALPWLVAAAHRVRIASQAERVSAWRRFVLVLGVMSLGGAPAWLLALLSAPLIVGWNARATGRQAALRVGGCLLVLGIFALPWSVPALLRPGGVRADPVGAEVFAPRSDTPLGVAVSVLTGGGVWNAETVPPGRDNLLLALAAVAMLVLAVTGVVRGRRGPMAPLAVAGIAGLAVTLLSSWDVGARALGRLAAGAVLRDSQRLLAPWLLLLALGLSAVVAGLAGRARREALPAVVLLGLLPVAVLPTLAWGVSGQLAAVAYPADFGQVRHLIAADNRHGAVLVLPFEAYRRFAWNHERPAMDPVSHWVDRTVIISSDLSVAVAGGRRVLVRGEDGLARSLGEAVRDAKAGGEQLARAAGRDGVRWVVTDAAVDPVLLTGLHAIYRGPDVSLYEIAPSAIRAADDPARAFAAPRGAVIAGDVVVASVLTVAGLWTSAAALTRLLQSRVR
jgi:hypothetical protein